MEECNNLAADCVVLSCCCPCLLLQLGIFILFRLPQRLAAKSKRLVMARKIKRRKLETNEVRKMEFGVDGGGGAPVVTALGGEEVWEVLLGHGVFWFGSFWGEGGSLENLEEIQLGGLEAIGAIVGWAQRLENVEC
ncbi:hypothetical protein MA16_Dca022814 [Dendrobium catenatum]|uniref:Uncharacterized protein n=1 Tax=Dendrobium catenatum TaxID=906689 RepID=A0A2I0W7S7_9ASPA|nr:hypothetical protein MA16_Dca022814 [Dendrobium catenatum]